MKNKIVLGLILMSVLLMSVVGISAQITGDYVNQNFEPVKTGAGNQEIGDNADGTSTSSTFKSETRASTARKSSPAPKGWEKVEALGGGECYVRASGKATGRFLGFMFRD